MPPKRSLRRPALGFPVALKALGIAHKSEHGAVQAQSARRGGGRDAAAKRLSGLGTGLYVERMVTGGVAELIVGITRDPIFGPVMTIGSGGVLVELLKRQRHAAAAGDPRRHRGGAARPETVSAARRLSRPAEGRSRRGGRCDLGHCRFRAGQCRRDRGTRHQPADRLRRRQGRLDRRRAAGAMQAQDSARSMS